MAVSGAYHVAVFKGVEVTVEILLCCVFIVVGSRVVSLVRGSWLTDPFVEHSFRAGMLASLSHTTC